MRLYHLWPSKSALLLLGAFCLLPTAASAATSSLPLSDDQSRATLQARQQLHVAWVEQTNDQQSFLLYQRQDLSGRPLSPRTVIHQSASRIRRPHLAVDASERVHLLWQERFAKEAGAKTSQGTWVHYAQLAPAAQGLTIVRQQVLNQRPNAMHPALAVDAQSIAYAVWEEGDNSVVLAKIVGHQRPVEFHTIAASFGKEGRGYPAVAVDRQGNVHLAWTNATSAGDSQIVYAMLAATDLGGRQPIVGQPLHAGAPVVGQPKQITIDDTAGQVKISWQNRRAEGPLGRLAALPVNSLTLRMKGSAARLATPWRVMDQHLASIPELPSFGELLAVTVKPHRPASIYAVMARIAPQTDPVQPLLQRFDDAIEKLKLAQLLAFSNWSSAPPSATVVASHPPHGSVLQFVSQQARHNHQFKSLFSASLNTLGPPNHFSQRRLPPTTQQITASFGQEVVIERV